MWKKLFGEANVKNAVTLFHLPSSSASTRILTQLQKASTAQPPRITLDVTEKIPTNDQLKSMLDYLGEGSAGKLVQGARDEEEAGRVVRMSGEKLKRPIVVDWNAGKVMLEEAEVEKDLKDKS